MNNKIRKNYEELAQSLGLRMDEAGGALYGKRGAYDLLIYPNNENYPYMLTVTVSAQRSAGPLEKDACKQFKREHKPVSALVHNGTAISMSLKNYPKLHILQQNLNESINALVSFLQAEGFRNCCQTCGKDNPVPCFVSGGYMQLCPECFSKIQHDKSMDYTQKQNKGENVIGGIVGAFLGSIVGVISMLIFSQLGYVAALSGVIMAICTFKGYEMLGGKLSKKGIFISAILMILMTLLGDRLDWAILIARELEVDFFTAFQVFPELLGIGAIEMGNYIANLAMLYLFTLAGAIPTIVSTVRNRKLEGQVYRLGGAVQNYEQEEL